MTPTEQIRTQLEHGPAGGGEIQVSQGDLAVRARLADWDRLGCLLDWVELHHRRGLPLRIDPDSVAEKVGYLGETLRVIETEWARGRALLRSARPLLREGSPSYFEVILDPALGLSLRRYAYDLGRGVRAAMTAPLTRQAFERLVEDLLALGIRA